MRQTISIFLLAFFCQGYSQSPLPMLYEIDLKSNPDTFLVQLTIQSPLRKDQQIFQFAATAPGTYQTMNIGRFVAKMHAYDKKGSELEITKKGINQYQLAKPHKLDHLTYEIAETFDTKTGDLPIHLMCGSSLEDDHALVNAHALLGFFEGTQSYPITLSFKRPQEWMVGASLPSENSIFSAKSYDHLVDSPFLLGQLTKADTTLSGTRISLFTYSKNDVFQSSQLLQEMSAMLEASEKFLITLPVKNYTFLYHFEPKPKGQTGAWEHAYSSEYVLKESKPTKNYLSRIVDLASHEFFHIVTPLNIHSEIIETFNFVEPTPSIHLWLYEGVTEWASNMLLFRGEVIDLTTYLREGVAKKIGADQQFFDSSWSLKKIALESYSSLGAKQYPNVYNRGSLVASLLDIRLLELSNGKYGLRELLLSLMEKYGKGKPISEQDFFKDLVAMTYPEIDDFINNYILDSKTLPIASYYEKIGISYSSSRDNHYLSKKKNISQAQSRLFDAWSQNLMLPN